jgi:hypothetical protein
MRMSRDFARGAAVRLPSLHVQRDQLRRRLDVERHGSTSRVLAHLKQPYNL